MTVNNATAELLDETAPTNAFELLTQLLEKRLREEIEILPVTPLVREEASLVRRMRSSLKQTLLNRLSGALISRDLSVVQHDTHSQDFLCYVLRHRPDLPLEYFPSDDYRLIRHFAINKLLFGAVRVFKSTDLYPAEFESERVRFAESVRAGLNRPVAGGYESFGFRTRDPIPPLADFGALVNHYGLIEFADRVPEGAILDVGSYNGDSSFAFAQHFPKRPILCFEPDPVNRQRLEETVRLNGLTNAEIVAIGAGIKAARLAVARPGSAGTSVQDLAGSEHFIEVDSLDHLLAERSVDRVGLIKLDIEGQERNALLGARNVISRDRPLLLIAAYHRGADIFELPALLRDMVPDYQFRFRHLDPCCPTSEYVIVAF